MVKVVPAMVSVAVRAAPGFAATAKVTVPLPLPEAPAEIVTKVALLVAVHAHPTPAVTGTDPVPPAALKDEVVRAPAVTVHDGAVGVAALLLFFEQATAASTRAAAAIRRRSENAMHASRFPCWPPGRAPLYTQPTPRSDTP
jgi:hypothetical protein